MNKQEAIETIKNIDTLNINDIIAGQNVDMVIKNQVIDIISQIHEPQKVVVQKFVAEWYEKNKDDLNTAIYKAITEIYRKINSDNDDWLDTFEGWLAYEDNSISILVQMQLFGYEIEQEKLYTVELKANDQVLSKHFGTIAFVHSSIALSQSYIQFSKSDLEQAGFGWVFDCDGVKVVEVE